MQMLMKGLIISLLLLFCTPSMGFTETLFLSILPRFSTEVVHERTSLLAKYLSEHTGIQIEPVVTNDFSSYQKRIKSGEIAIGLHDPVVYVKVSDIHEASAVVIKNNKPELTGVIVTRMDSEIRSIEDLSGKSIAYTGEGSAAGYLSQKLTMKEHGVDLHKDCTLISAIDNKQENVLFSVYAGDADAGLVARPALRQVEKFIPAGQIKILAETAAMPNWTLSLRRDLPQASKDKILDAILNIPKDHPLLKKFEVNGFAPANDALYDSVRAAMNIAGQTPKATNEQGSVTSPSGQEPSVKH